MHGSKAETRAGMSCIVERFVLPWLECVCWPNTVLKPHVSNDQELEDIRAAELGTGFPADNQLHRLLPASCLCCHRSVDALARFARLGHDTTRAAQTEHQEQK